MIQCCPECDNHDIRISSPGSGLSWWCSDCHARFDDPKERERKRPGGGRFASSHARALLDADPEEVGHGE